MFRFTLVGLDGESVPPGSVSLSVPMCRPGEVIAVGAGLSYRIVRVLESGEEEPDALVVEEA